MQILTFDIEEWFHIFADDIEKWDTYESRIQKNMERIFVLLKQYKQQATFFCIGWICKKYPDIIRNIDNCGYEIGSHSTMHQLVYNQNKVQFQKDLECSIKSIEDLIGKKVKYFRAPGFSITENNKWTFEILVEQGIEIDSSIFPSSHSFGGFPSYKKAVPSIIRYNGMEIKEFPINYKNIFGKSIIYSGGGYFRFFPYELISKWAADSDYMMSYFHPRDLDKEQPVLEKLTLERRIKSYIGLNGAEDKIKRWLSDFKFIDIKTADEIIDWQNVPVIKI
jgi:peptidoglycan-N-acetylglucosamine deacetylase